jgi:hypothetical protein
VPGVCGGKACIAGHRVRVHAALAYYFDHIEEIQQEMQAERTFADEFRRNSPSLLEAKLRQERLEEAS